MFGAFLFLYLELCSLLLKITFGHFYVCDIRVTLISGMLATEVVSTFKLSPRRKITLMKKTNIFKISFLEPFPSYLLKKKEKENNTTFLFPF